MSGLVEFFTLREAAAAAAREAPERRDARALLLRRARQKRDAAEALWSVSQAAEALRLAVESLALFLDAAREAAARETAAREAEAAGDAGPVAGDDVSAVLRALGAPPKVAARVGALAGRVEALALPALDADVTSEHLTLYRDLGDALAALDEATAPFGLLPREIRARRAARLGAAALFAALAVGVAAFWLTRPERIAATASASYANDPQFGPEKAVDGLPETEWLLPDHATGHLELRLPRPRTVSGVRLLNGHNRQFNDRAVREYTVELYAGARLVGSKAGEFVEFRDAPTWTDVDVRGDAVDRVRVVVRSAHRMGAALAEIELK
jgi:hypothetical protein